MLQQVKVRDAIKPQFHMLFEVPMDGKTAIIRIVIIVVYINNG